MYWEKKGYKMEDFGVLDSRKIGNQVVHFTTRILDGIMMDDLGKATCIRGFSIKYGDRVIMSVYCVLGSYVPAAYEKNGDYWEIVWTGEEFAKDCGHAFKMAMEWCDNN